MFISCLSRRWLAVSLLWYSLGYGQQTVEIETKGIKKPLIRAMSLLLKAINGDRVDDRHTHQEPSYLRAQRDALAQCTGDNSFHASAVYVSIQHGDRVHRMKRYLDTFFDAVILMNGEQPVQKKPMQNTYTINIDDERAYLIALKRSLEDQRQKPIHKEPQHALPEPNSAGALSQEDNGAGIGL